MAKKRAFSVPSTRQRLGSYMFLFGVVVALITGTFTPKVINVALASILIGLGVIIGILNVTVKEINSFLLAAVALVLISGLGAELLSKVTMIGGYLEGILLSLMLIVVPATIIVALKSIFTLAHN